MECLFYIMISPDSPVFLNAIFNNAFFDYLVLNRSYGKEYLRLKIINERQVLKGKYSEILYMTFVIYKLGIGS